MTNTFATSDLRSNLPGVYDVGAKVQELLNDWGVVISPAQYCAPAQVVQGLDYGHDQDSVACAVSFNRAAGQEVNQDIVSVVPFDSNGLGSWAARESLARFGDGKDGQRLGTGTLFVLNSAPGRNVPDGTKDNVRERLFGAKLHNGAIVVATESDHLWEYLADQAETIVDLDLWKSGSQARGIDVFQTMGYAFYQEASQPGWKGGTHERITVTSRAPEANPTPLTMSLRGLTHVDGVPRYVSSSKDHAFSSAFQRVPVPSNDLQAAGYSAFRLANGSQCRRTFNDPNNVPAVYVIADGFDLNSQQDLRVWAQLQNDGSIVVGPPDPDAWRFSPAEQPIVAIQESCPARHLFSFADQIFSSGRILRRLGPEVGDLDVALPLGPVPGRIDYFGNHDVHNADPKLGRTFSFHTPGGTLHFPVRESMFDAEIASMDNPEDPDAAGFSQQASGGGWRVRIVGPKGELLTRWLQTSQAYVRTDTPELPSAAHRFNANRVTIDGQPGPFELPAGVRISQSRSQNFEATMVATL